MQALSNNKTPGASKIVRINQPESFPTPKLGIVVPTADGLEIIKTLNITHCNAEGSYCHVHLRNGTSLMVSKNLKAVEKALTGNGFYRVHQSHLVCFNDIAKLQTEGLALENGALIPVARSKRKELINLLLKSYQQL